MKLFVPAQLPHPCGVAPRAGARIETAGMASGLRRTWSPPVRGRGLKPLRVRGMAAFGSRPPCGGAD